MNEKDMYWNLFIASGDPEAYMQYRQNAPAFAGPDAFGGGAGGYGGSHRRRGGPDSNP